MSLTRRLGLALLVALALLASGRDALAICTKSNICDATTIVSGPTACCSATSCTLDGTITLSGATCTLDFGARNVTLSGTLVVGSNTVSIEAASFRIIAAGLVNARGASSPSPGGNVTMNLTGGASPTLDLIGSASSGIDLSGFGRGGGTFTAQVNGPVRILTGSITAGALDAFANGGTITIGSSAGDMTIGTSVTANSDIGGAGGTVDLASAGDLTVTGSGRLGAIAGEGFGGEIDIAAGGSFTVATGGLLEANAKNGSASDGGEINVSAASINIQGEVQAKGGGDPTGDVGGSGGSVSMETGSGAIVLMRGTTPGITVDGAGGGEGGEMTLTTNSPANGGMTLAAPLSAQGKGGLAERPAGGGLIEATAAAGIVISKSINVSGVGGGSGVVDIASGAGDLTVNNSIVGSDRVGGGTVNLTSGHDIVLANLGVGHNIKMNADSTGDGVGGAIALAADNDILLTDFLLDASGAGTGYGGEIDLDAGRHLTIDKDSLLDANSSAGSGAVAGSVTLTAGGADRLGRLQTGNLQIDGDVRANGHAPAGAANPASITLSGCQVTISGTALLDSTGDVDSANVVVGRAGITVATNGKLRATKKNTAIYRATGAPPAVSGQVSPSFTLETRPTCTAPNTPAGCLVPCPACGDSTVSFPEQCDPPGCPTCDIRCRTLSPIGCNDGNACTSDNCSPTFGCRNDPVVDGISCNDANTCTVGETCQLGLCSGLVRNCDDDDPCTTDTCDATDGCMHTPVVCPSDGNACNGAETCSPPGGCHHGTLVTCPAGQVCDPPTGSCVTKQCTVPANCNDNNPCTNDICASGTCSNTPVANGSTPPGCGDSNMCNGSESCQSGVCAPGVPPELDDGNICTNDTCDPVIGPLHTDIPGCCRNVGECAGSNQCTQCVGNQCSVVANCCTVAADCDDGNPCTGDTCNAPQCVHAPLSGGACGDVCAPGTCQSGTCDAAPLECPADTDVCTEDICDPIAGCIHRTIVGCCSSVTQCQDDDPCTVDECDADSHVCKNDPLFLGCAPCGTDTDCDPMGACGQSICDTAAGVCMEHLAPNCTDGNARTQDLCVVDGPGQAHCENPCFPGVCDDHNACNGTETCAPGGTCVSAAALDCNDRDECTRDSCDPAAGCVHRAETGFASVRCRLDAIALLLQEAEATEISNAARAKVSGLVGKARVKLDAAERAGSGKPALKALKASGKKLKAITKAVKTALRKKKIGAELADGVLTAAGGATQAIETLKASVTP